MVSSPVAEKVGRDEIDLKKDDQEQPVDCSEDNMIKNNMVSSPVAEKVGRDEIDLNKDDQEQPVDCSEDNMASSVVAEKVGGEKVDLKNDNEAASVDKVEPMNNGESDKKIPVDCSEENTSSSLVAGKMGRDEIDLKKGEEGETMQKVEPGDNNGENIQKVYSDKGQPDGGVPLGDQEGEHVQKQEHSESSAEMKSMHTDAEDGPKVDLHVKQDDSPKKINEGSDLEPRTEEETSGSAEEIQSEEKEEAEPVFDGTEVPGTEDSHSLSFRSFDILLQNQEFAKDKAVALSNFVKEKGVVAASTVSTVLRRLSLKRDETGSDVADGGNKTDDDSSKESESKEASQNTGEKSTWNPLSYIIMSRDGDADQKKVNIEIPQPMTMEGRIILYTRLGCQESKKVRQFLYSKRLRYVEINIDLYPGRKEELGKLSGSSSVPKVLFNERIIGGLSELEHLDESGKLGEKIDYLVTEPPSFEAPLPPLSGEDDVSSSEPIDDLAVIVRKMKGSIAVKDRFYKMRRFTKCFLGSEAVDFISEDQYLERQEAVEFGQKLVQKLFFRHVLDENLLEDGNHLYRFLDDDPIVSSQCHNIPRGIIEMKQRPIADIASRLRFLSYVIFEAYTSEDGRHVDYRTIHGSEEFARYLRTVEELQRVELNNMPREEKLAFFINLYNMMAIHCILVWGYPLGPLERRRMFGDFKYVIAGCTYSLSSIQNGILRGNQRPPYNLLKPFVMNDKRSEVALPYPEPLTLFTLVSGSRSGPALRCYSPANIDTELMEAAGNFLRTGGLIINLQNNVVFASVILKWFSVDFGKNEIEVLRHASNYLEAKDKEALLELLSRTDQLKVMYQPYDWGVNC